MLYENLTGEQVQLIRWDWKTGLNKGTGIFHLDELPILDLREEVALRQGTSFLVGFS